jgi:hypothetical protein
MFGLTPTECGDGNDVPTLLVAETWNVYGPLPASPATMHAVAGAAVWHVRPPGCAVTV